MSEKLVFAELKASGQLPTPKGIALTVMQLTQEENVSLHELAHVIQGDPALAGRIIKLANSVNPNRNRPIAAVTTDTLILIGVQAVRAAVLYLSVMQDYRKGRCPLFDYDRFWSCALATGAAAQAIGSALHIAPPAEMFNCGLMSGIGELALVTARPQAYSELLAQQPADLEEAQRARFGLDQHALMVLMLQDWGLPPLFIDALYHRRAPARCGHPVHSRPMRITLTFQLADVLAQACMRASDDRPVLDEAIQIGEQLGLDAAHIATLLEQTAASWADWGKLLDVPTRPVAGMRQPAKAPPLPQSPPPTDTPLRILLASADSAQCALLGELLRTAGHQVTICDDGTAALAALEQHAIDTIIADWLLPGMDGISLCRTLRARPGGESVYYIVLNPFEDERRRIEAYEAGTDDFLRTPVNPRLFLALLRAAQRARKRHQPH